MNDIATDVAAAIKKRTGHFAPSLPATLKRTGNALRGDSALQFVSISQTSI
jgi:hypothetical protein